VQLASFEVVLDDRGDLEFPPVRWLDQLSGLDDALVEVVEPGDRPVARRLAGFSSILVGRPSASRSTMPYRWGSLTW
jgi:hypothetical protein